MTSSCVRSRRGTVYDTANRSSSSSSTGRSIFTTVASTSLRGEEVSRDGGVLALPEREGVPTPPLFPLLAPARSAWDATGDREGDSHFEDACSD